MRSPSEFERAPDRGASEVAVYEAYLEAGFRGVIPSLIGEVSSFFGFCPSQLTPLTWRTVIAIQVRGELHGFSVGSRNLRGISGAIIPSGIAGTIDTGSEAYNGSSSAILMGDFSGNVVRLSVLAIYDEHQKGRTQKRRPFYTPPPRLARAALSVNGLSSTSSTGAEAVSNDDPLVDAHRRLIGEVLFLRSQVQDMMARRDLLIQQVKAPARWEFMKEWLEKRVEHWDPEEEYHRRLFLYGGIDQQLGNFSRVATPRSAVGSRFSEEPSF
ncbi:BnaC03g75020D [Brassica napus]|uniref:BnaC03g75020D protein n=1 Tax=Brassica napus TaxID=3708 RepID=A0A078JFA0_BRANA|nr:BnaC03g75020D [Brassica napus]